jgi:uncharacterized membrane protein (UPF0127 family)
MKKIFSIISIIILFILSILIFWAGLSPKTFFKFFEPYPEVNKVVNQVGIFDIKSNGLSKETLSDTVSGSQGSISIRGVTWEVEIANDDESRTNGLSNRTSLHGMKGMLFVFDQLAPQSFWMKDMLIPIDIIFFDNNWRIVLIESNLQPKSFPKAFGGSVKSQYVLEINASESSVYGLQVGDQAIFKNK